MIVYYFDLDLGPAALSSESALTVIVSPRLDYFNVLRLRLPMRCEFRAGLMILISADLLSLPNWLLLFGDVILSLGLVPRALSLYFLEILEATRRWWSCTVFGRLTAVVISVASCGVFLSLMCLGGCPGVFIPNNEPLSLTSSYSSGLVQAAEIGLL